MIVLIAEQFRADYLTAYANWFRNAGFKRLIDEGVYYTQCQSGSAAFSSSGLATISTGTVAGSHGIVAERWFDAAAHQTIAASGGGLLAGTLAEEVVSADPHNRVFAIGLSDSHCGLLTGQAASSSFSLDNSGHWSASNAAAPWFRAFQDANSPERYRDVRWASMNSRAGAPPMRTLRYDAGHPSDFLALFQASPFAQSMQFQLLRELVQRESLGRGPGLDSVFVSLDSIGALSYQTGAQSPLVIDMVATLDREIAALLSFLQGRPALNYNLVFTGCHGAPVLHTPKKSVAGEDVARAIDRALEARYGEHRILQAYLYPFAYLDAGKLRRIKANPRDARELAGRAAVASGKVNAYYTADGDCSHAGEWQRRLSNSFQSARSGDLIVSYPHGFVEDYGAPEGISYGSIYNYDVRVPLIFYGPQLRPAVVDSAAELADIAPTLSRTLGIAEPSSSTGRVLEDALPFTLPKERK